jgi:hypothetical protein
MSVATAARLCYDFPPAARSILMALTLDTEWKPAHLSGGSSARTPIASWRKAIATGLLLFMVFNMNCRGIASRDSRIIEMTAANIALSGSATLDRFPDMSENEGVAEIGGHALPLYPVIPALIAAPAFRLAATAGFLAATSPSQESLDAIGKAAASALTATACAFLYLVVRRWLPNAPAAAIVVAAALSTPYWSTASQALWSHATAACALAMALWASARINESIRAALLAGLGVAVAVCTRPLLVPFALGMAIYGRRARHRWWLAATIAGVFGCLAIWNVAVFGHLLGGAAILESPGVHRQTHLVDAAWTLHVIDGAEGILFSPNRGLLIFMPLVCWTVIGGARLWRTSSEARLTIILPTVLYLIGWSAYAVWWGGHSYGPRYATDLIVPLTIMGAFAFFDGATSARAWSARLATVALAWGIGVQAVGAFCYPGGDWNDLPVNVDQAHARLWDWSDLEIVRTAAAGPYSRHLPRLSRAIRRRFTHRTAAHPAPPGPTPHV